MPFDWAEYLHLARLLAQGSIPCDLEAALRTAMSRAYYAAYCHSRNYAQARLHFAPTSDPADHRLLREHFRQQRMADVARRLDQLRQWRNHCDYRDTVYNLPTILQQAITLAQE